MWECRLDNDVSTSLVPQIFPSNYCESQYNCGTSPRTTVYVKIPTNWNYLIKLIFSGVTVFSVNCDTVAARIPRNYCQLSHKNVVGWFPHKMSVCGTLNSAYQRIYINFRTNSTHHRLQLEGLSQPLSALSAVYCTIPVHLYNGWQSRRRESFQLKTMGGAVH